jgi:hypothetical protein
VKSLFTAPLRVRNHKGGVVHSSTNALNSSAIRILGCLLPGISAKADVSGNQQPSRSLRSDYAEKRALIEPHSRHIPPRDISKEQPPLKKKKSADGGRDAFGLDVDGVPSFVGFSTINRLVSPKKDRVGAIGSKLCGGEIAGG